MLRSSLCWVRHWTSKDINASLQGSAKSFIVISVVNWDLKKLDLWLWLRRQAQWTQECSLLKPMLLRYLKSGLILVFHSSWHHMVKLYLRKCVSVCAWISECVGVSLLIKLTIKYKKKNNLKVLKLLSLDYELNLKVILKEESPKTFWVPSPWNSSPVSHRTIVKVAPKWG